MPPRSRRLVLGLRGRIVGALLVTTVATLGIAAVALLGPLEQQLRNSALATLQREVSQATAGFQKLNLGASQTSPVAQRRLQSQANALAVRIGAPNVSVFAYPLVQLTFYDAESERGDTFDDVNSAFRNLAEGKKGKAAAVPSFGTLEGTDVARVAMPITLPGRGGQTYVLAVRKTIEEIPGAVKVVRTAFITAALAGVALTLILGIPLAATLVRRLRRHPAAGELSLSESSALARLDRGGPASAAALARLEQISPQSMGATLGGLEARGLVERRPDSDDGRRVVLSVSAVGRQVLFNRRRARTERLAQALATSFSDAERAQLLAVAPLLERLAQSI